ncbi:MAG: hypothetical protein U0905_18980 [Pirellulales bacterium]
MTIRNLKEAARGLGADRFVVGAHLRRHAVLGPRCPVFWGRISSDGFCVGLFHRNIFICSDDVPSVANRRMEHLLWEEDFNRRTDVAGNMPLTKRKQ